MTGQAETPARGLPENGVDSARRGERRKAPGGAATPHVYDDSAWNGRDSGYLQALRSLELEGLIRLGHDEQGEWGYFLNDEGATLLEECGYVLDVRAADNFGASLMTAALEVLDGQHETIKEALLDPELHEAWQRLLNLRGVG